MIVFNNYWIVTIIMKTILQTVLNAMEYANTGNQHEFHLLLEKDVFRPTVAAPVGKAGERQQPVLDLNVKHLYGA